jgi:hypothetical protein
MRSYGFNIFYHFAVGGFEMSYCPIKALNYAADNVTVAGHPPRDMKQPRPLASAQ